MFPASGQFEAIELVLIKKKSRYDDDRTKPNFCSSRWRETYIQTHALLPSTLAIFESTISPAEEYVTSATDVLDGSMRSILGYSLMIHTYHWSNSQIYYQPTLTPHYHSTSTEGNSTDDVQGSWKIEYQSCCTFLEFKPTRYQLYKHPTCTERGAENRHWLL